MKRKVIAVVSAFLVTALMFGTSCSSCDRSMKSCASEYGDGLQRAVNVYDFQGDLIAHYDGKLDVQVNESKVLFDLDGKRYIYYNCLVEIIEK